jgi:hypothetical protein
MDQDLSSQDAPKDTDPTPDPPVQDLGNSGADPSQAAWAQQPPSNMPPQPMGQPPVNPPNDDGLAQDAPADEDADDTQQAV